MANDKLYANGRIAVLSTKLLGQEKFTRLCECVTVQEALKVLSECGYGGGITISNPNDYEKILIAEADGAMQLLKELCADRHAVAYLLCRYLYHNAKLQMKRKYMREDGVDGCFEGVGTNPQDLLDCFKNDDYSQCSKAMAEACDKVDTAFADGNRSPQVVDVCLDKAMFADMKEHAQKSHLALVKQLADWEINTVNLMLAYRLKKAAADASVFEDWLVLGGSLKREKLLAFWQDEKTLSEFPEVYKRFATLCTQENANLMAAEVFKKTHRNAIINENADFLTIQPVVAYFFNKIDETDKVRLILINIKNGVDKEKIKEKIKW